MRCGRVGSRIPGRSVLWPLLAISLLASGCGGGAALFAGGGIGGTGLSTGVIAAFGSVVIDDVHYLTDNQVGPRFRTMKIVEGMDDTGTADNVAFRIGMVVRIHHGADDNIATRIDFLDDLEGPVSGKNPDNTFDILGQAVLVDGGTHFYDDTGTPPFGSFADIGDNNVLQVSGLADQAGVIHATFIERKRPAPPGGMYEIKGYVSGLDTATKRFTIGPLPNTGTVVVAYENAMFENLPPGGLADGIFVEVETLSTAGPMISARNVEGRDSEADEAAGVARLSMEGFPANIDNTAETFDLNAVRVTTSADTRYVDAAGGPRNSFASVTATTRLKAEGSYAAGVLSADTITFR